MNLKSYENIRKMAEWIGSIQIEGKSLTGEDLREYLRNMSTEHLALLWADLTLSHGMVKPCEPHRHGP